MWKITKEIFGSGPWQYSTKAGRTVISAIILASALAWICLLVQLVEIGAAVLG